MKKKYIKPVAECEKLELSSYCVPGEVGVSNEPINPPEPGGGGDIIIPDDDD